MLELKALIAKPREVIRIGLRTLIKQTELTILPMNKTILLVDEPEIALFVDVRMRNVRGYLSTNISPELLFAALHSAEDPCLHNPGIFPWIMEHLFRNRQKFMDLLLLPIWTEDNTIDAPWSLIVKLLPCALPPEVIGNGVQ